MMVECSINRRSQKGDPSLAEVVWSSGDVDKAMRVLPSTTTAKIGEEIRRLLQPWPDGRYTDAYHRSGGILNAFTPPWGEKEDEVWAEMLAGWKAQTFADENARQEALRALERQWNTTPHPFFAGLTPAQVMTGGGPQESDLASEFLRQLTRTYDRQPFESEGDALIKTLIALRGWQCEPQKDGRTVRDIIIAERDELLARRARTLSECGG